MTPCKFFAQGLCRNGDSCNFIHERSTSTQNHFGPVVSAFPAIERLNINPAAATHLNGGTKSTRICTFFLQGSCNKGDRCSYVHPPAIVPPQQAHPDTISLDPYLGQQDESSPQAPSDSRARVPCKFLSRPGGCQNGSCPYLHTVEGHEVEKSSSQDFEVNEDEASNYSHDLCVEVSIEVMNRTKSVTTILLEIFQAHQSTSTNLATFSKSPSRQTSPLHALQALRREQLLKQSSISFVT
jgi:hypothetical protein